MDQGGTRDKQGSGTAGPRSTKRADPADDAFRSATELHQQGDLAGALRLYEQIVRTHPGSPTADLAKTLIDGLRQERINSLWRSASDARAQCDAAAAVKLYQRIIGDRPASPDAASARNEIAALDEIRPLWEAALSFHAQGSDPKALAAYQQIVSRFPASPEAENAGLLMAILHQNQLMPDRGTAPPPASEGITPEQIVSHLLAHRRATAGAGTAATPAMAKAEAQSQRIEGIWTQAAALESEGKAEEALLLYQKIIATSENGHRVRDAKYRVEKMKTRQESVQRSYGEPAQWGLAEDRGQVFFERRGVKWALVAAGLALVLLGAAALVYVATRPPSWTDIVENAKKAVVTVRTPVGAGTGFLITPEGHIITNAGVVGKEKEVDVRLPSGEFKRAEVIRVGMKLLDVAQLKIDGHYQHVLPLSGKDPCQDGAEVRVVGAPLGAEYFITRGIINNCSMDRYGVKYIQTEAAITVGNSGGPCLNRAGRVIGLSTPIQLGDSSRGPNLILPKNVIRDFIAGNLVAVEERLLKHEEEQARQAEASKQQVYVDIESINRRLQAVSAGERKAYLAKVSEMLRQRQVTSQQANIMVEQVNYGPTGSVSMEQWVQSLALKAAKGEFSEESAVQLIKNQYAVR